MRSTKLAVACVASLSLVTMFVPRGAMACGENLYNAYLNGNGCFPRADSNYQQCQSIKKVLLNTCGVGVTIPELLAFCGWEAIVDCSDYCRTNCSPEVCEALCMGASAPTTGCLPANDPDWIENEIYCRSLTPDDPQQCGPSTNWLCNYQGVTPWVGGPGPCGYGPTSCLWSFDETQCEFMGSGCQWVQ
jgi:hypothetical protein